MNEIEEMVLEETAEVIEEMEKETDAHKDLILEEPPLKALRKKRDIKETKPCRRRC